MIPTNTKLQRKRELNKLEPSEFESYRDSFIALHLNTYTQLMHLIGAIIGILFFILSIYFHNLILFLINIFFFYGFGFLSHYLFDGIISRTAKEAPWGSFRYAVELNILFLTGKIKSIEQELFSKYPFLISVYH